MRSTDWTHACLLLSQGGSLITANNRLARSLESRLAAQQNHSIWDSVRIFTWNTWLAQEYAQLVRQGQASAMPLSALQEQLLWEDIAHSWQQNVSSNQRLLQCNMAAGEAAKAWRSMHEWLIDKNILHTYGWHAETRLLMQWAQRVENHCNTHHLISRHALAAQLLAHFNTLDQTEPRTLILSGFDFFTPGQHALLERLQALGWTLFTLTEAQQAQSIVTTALTTADDELEAAAAWAAHTIGLEPQKRIGIIVPDLQQRLPQVERVFLSHLQPHSHSSHASTQTGSLHISLGQALAQHPMVQDALLMLKLCFSTLSIDELTRLLHSPYLGEAAVDLVSRVELDLQLRQTGQLQYDLASLLHFSPSQADSLPFFVSLHAIAEHLSTINATRFTRFSHVSAQLLQIAAWPGTQQLAPEQYQVRQAFGELLDNLSLLDRIGINPGAATGMLRRLQQLAQETTFQLRQGDCQVQIMGMLEAAGQQFDALWVCGMTTNAWPPAPQPNAMLPLQLQRAHDMPRSHAARELELAQIITNRLQQSAAQVIFSYAQAEGDSELQLSSLLQDLPSWQSHVRTAHPVFQLTEKSPLDEITDFTAPRLAGVAPIAAKGGTALLENQALCPFRAFAEHRLHAQAPATPKPGMDALTKGALVHRCLEFFWRRIKSNIALRQLSAMQLQDILDAAIAQAVNKEQLHARFSAQLIAIETARLQKLLSEWLAVELLRTDFTVLACEEKLDVVLGQLSLTTRIDRIDQLADGSHLIIDYKTGKPKPLGWLQEQLTEPQLPLYATGSSLNVTAAAFGYVKTGNCSFKGLAADTEQSGIRLEQYDDWQGLKNRWQTQLTKLADGFVEGHAQATASIKACQYCDLPTLCRKQDSATVTDEEDVA